jgi:hypothetical protein
VRSLQSMMVLFVLTPIALAQAPKSSMHHSSDKPYVDKSAPKATGQDPKRTYNAAQRTGNQANPSQRELAKIEAPAHTGASQASHTATPHTGNVKPTRGSEEATEFKYHPAKKSSGNFQNTPHVGIEATPKKP